LLITPRTVFVHLPRTGGMWIRHLIFCCNGIPAVMTDPPHACLAVPAAGGLLPAPGASQPDTARAALAGRLPFTFIRDPAAWWRSWWQAFISPGPGWQDRCPGFPPARLRRDWQPATRHQDCPTYEQFMDRMLADAPGIYSRAADLYTAGIRVCRFEDLPSALPAVLAEAGETVTVIPPAPRNAARYSPAAATTPELDAAIRDAEKQVIAQYYR
jgi:hypothetical protein